MSSLAFPKNDNSAPLALTSGGAKNIEEIGRPLTTKMIVSFSLE